MCRGPHGLWPARFLCPAVGCVPSSRGSSQPRDRTCLSDIPCTGRQFLTSSATWEAWVLRVAAVEPQRCLRLWRIPGTAARQASLSLHWCREWKPPVILATKISRTVVRVHAVKSKFTCLTQRPNKPKPWSLEQKVLLQGQQRERMAHAQNPNSLMGWGRETLTGRTWGEGCTVSDFLLIGLVLRVPAGIARPEVTSLHCLGPEFLQEAQGCCCVRAFWRNQDLPHCRPTVS